MSTTAVAPASVLIGPPPRPRPHGLLTIPGVLVDDPDAPQRWLTLVNVIGYPPGVPGVWEPCSTGTFRVKGEGEARPQDRFAPFGAYTALHCNTQSMGDYDRFYDEAEAVLDATLSHAVEEVLSQGVDSNPFFGDTGMDVLASGAAVSPRIGLSLLENAIGAETGRLGMIHGTPGIVTAWGSGGGLSEKSDGVLRTSSGTPVADGSGYIGAHPAGPGLAGPSETIEWAFATGPVEVRVEEETRRTVDTTVDQNTNFVVVRAERYVLAEWDKAFQAGVLIDWSLTP